MPGEKEKKAVHDRDDRRGVLSKQLPKKILNIMYLPHKIFGSQTSRQKKVQPKPKSTDSTYTKYNKKHGGNDCVDYGGCRKTRFPPPLQPKETQKISREHYHHRLSLIELEKAHEQYKCVHIIIHFR